MTTPEAATRDPRATDTDQSLVKQLLTEVQQLRDTVADQQATIEELEATVEDQQDTIDELETTVDAQRQTITDQVARLNALDDRVAALDTSHEKTRDIARTAIAQTEQQAAATDRALPAECDPATSPLDFFANCRQARVEERFVVDTNRTNTYRAIAVAKRWPEFAQHRNDGEAVFFTRDTLERALTAQMGAQPHRQTIQRVWDTLVELGGADLVEKRHRISTAQQPKELLVMDVDTAEGLLDQRYRGLELLAETDGPAPAGGVTPVVTGATG